MFQISMIAKKPKLLIRVYTIIFLCLLFSRCYSQSPGHADSLKMQDTVRLTINQAEQSFLTNNLSLLAQKYNISAQKALIIQARLYPNPNINVVQGVYETLTHQWFATGTNGEEAVQLQQLILLAGKLNKQVKIAETNASLAEYTFFDMLRTLKFTLRNDFYSIYFLQRSADVYGEEIRSLQQINAAFEEQRDKGYIARSEVVRIKAQLYSLQSELNDVMNQIRDRETELRLIIQVSPNFYILPQADTVNLMQQDPLTFSLQSLIDSAYQNRTDLKLARTNKMLSQQNLAYQKSLAVPDLNVGGTYDRRGSYIPNFNGVSVGLNIPLFNRNQGNIKAYKSLIDYNELQVQNTQKTIEEQVYRGLERAIDANRLYQSMDKSFTGEFSQLAQAMFDNYRKRNVTLIDFLNFYDAYKQYIVQLNYILSNRTTSLENINFLTGTNFFNK